MTERPVDDLVASSTRDDSSSAPSLSARLLEHVAEMIPGVIYAFRRDANGQFSIPYANSALERLFGTTPGSLRQNAGAIFEHIHPDDVPGAIASIEASARNLSRWEARFRVLHPTLGERSFIGQSMPEATDDGAVVWYGFVADVTEQRRAEDALREREAMLSAIIDNSPSVLTVKDVEGRYVLVNPNARRTLALDEAGIIGKTAFDLFDEATARTISENDRRVIESNARVAVKERVQVGATATIYDSHKFPIRDSSGAPRYVCSISLDVTQRDRDAAALAERELLFRSVFDQQFQYVAILDPQGRVREVNDLPIRAAGGTRDDYVGQYFWMTPGWRDLPEWYDVWKGRLEAAAQSDRPIVTDDVARLPDGSTVYFEASVSAVRNASGGVEFFHVQANDTTGRKRAEAAVRESDENNRLVLESLADGVFVANARGLLYANSALQRTLGYDATEFASVAPTDLVAPEHLERWSSVERAVGERGETAEAVRIDFMKRGSSERVMLELRASPIRFRGEGALLCVARDITERLRTEASAREIDARFRQVVETIREVFWLTDVDKQVMLYVSPAYESIWGRSLDSLMTSPESWIEAIHRDDRERVRAAAMRDQALGTYDEEYRIVRPDGTVRWIHDVAYPVRDEAGRVVRVVGVAEDVTERRTLEVTLRQAQKMESIGQLAGGVAHDFNNALTVILGCVQLLAHDRAIPEESRELLKEISLAGERAASLTRQLLAFSRQEVLSPKVLNLNASILDTRRMLDRLLGEDIRIVTTLDGSLPSVKVDPGHVAQLLMNLSVNARDAMPNGGTLEFSTHLVRHDVDYVRAHPGSSEGDFVELLVRDSGSGMSPQVLARVFEPFFTTKEVGRGTGLGLAVVHGIVTHNGGTIDVESSEGIGTTFRIAFPAVYAPPAGPAAITGVVTTSQRERILLVEDDNAVRRLALRALESAHYRVLAASDGVQALELLAKHGGAIDALVTDVVMPNMSGSDLAHGVRSICPSARILLTSGYTNDALSRNGVDQTDLHFLQKPYSIESLLRAVRELLDSP